MIDLRAYRLGFAPVLAVVVVLAFSVRGVPEPLEPAAGTIQFDARSAAAATRELARLAPDREPGAEDAGAAADWVRDRFEEVASGTVAEQGFEASLEGSDVELRNVLLTLRGAGERAILIVAARSAGDGPGFASSAAATGVLVELAAELGVSGRERTLIFGSIDGGDGVAEGVREMVEALPDAQAIDAAVVISQPGASRLVPPNLVTSSSSQERPSLALIRTAEDALRDRGRVGAGLDGALGQIARLAVPAAAGAQAALLAEGIDAVAVSAAGEASLSADESGQERLSTESLERFGATALALAGALDASTTPASGPSTYVRIGDNRVPGWGLALLALAVLVPPALPVALLIARSRRDGTVRPAVTWAAEWTLVGLVPLGGLLILALVGLIPRPESPYDPGRFEIGATEVLAVTLLAGLAIGAWRALGLRRPPALPAPVLGSAAAATCLAACGLAWLANPFIALLLAPLSHVVVVHALRGRRPAALSVPVALAACVPLAAALLHVATELDWGLATPWQLVLLIAGGGLGLVPAIAIAAGLSSTAAMVQASYRVPGSPVGAAPQEPSRGLP